MMGRPVWVVFFAALVLGVTGFGKSADDFYREGVRLASMGKHLEAMAVYEKAIARNPMHEKAHEKLAKIYARLGLLEKAMAENRKIIDLNPENALRTNKNQRP